MGGGVLHAIPCPQPISVFPEGIWVPSGNRLQKSHASLSGEPGVQGILPWAEQERVPRNAGGVGEAGLCPEFS